VSLTPTLQTKSSLFVVFVHFDVSRLAIHTGYKFLHNLLCSISYIRLLSPQFIFLSFHSPSCIQLASGFHIMPDGFDWRGPIASASISAGQTRVSSSFSSLHRNSIVARSQNTTIRLPLLQVLLAINSSARLSVLPGLRDLLNALCDEWRQLDGSQQRAPSHPTKIVG
jgi:hypothetical protein